LIENLYDEDVLVRVLIPGGSGFLGVALVDALLENQHEVIILSRSPNTVKSASNVRVVAWDGKTPQGWGHLVGEVDAIINLAGSSIGAGRWTQARKVSIRSSRQQAGRAIVAAVEKAAQKPTVLIQASGIGAYGDQGDLELDETSPRGSDFLASVTGDWEASTAPVEQYGVRQVVIRTGLVTSRTADWIQPVLLIFRLFAGGPLGSGNQWWPWIHIQDYVNGVLFLLNQPDACGVYNLVSPNPSRMKEFGKELASVLKRPYWLPAPAFAIKLVLGALSMLILEGQRALPKRLLESGYVYQHFQLRPALVEFFG
jgi:uncharacterized protein (TIGR01777 family)